MGSIKNVLFIIQNYLLLLYWSFIPRPPLPLHVWIPLLTQLFSSSQSCLIWAPLIPIKAHLHLSRLACGINRPSYTHTSTLLTVRAVTPRLCVREDTESEPNLPRRQYEVTAPVRYSPPHWMVLGYILGRGSDRSDPPASPLLSLTWMTSKRPPSFFVQASKQHRNVLKSAGLRSGSSKRHFGPLGPASIYL